jgi:ketosteroid isomerase-like protein
LPHFFFDINSLHFISFFFLFHFSFFFFTFSPFSSRPSFTVSSGQQQQNQQEERPPPFFRFPPFVASVADSFIGGSELESGGNARLSLQLVLVSFSRIAALTAPVDAAIPRALATVAPMLNACIALMVEAAKVKDAATFEPFIAHVLQRLGESHSTPMLVVGGWRGLQSEATLVHVIEQHQQQRTASFTTLATGAGLEYHSMTPCDTDATPPKVKYATSLRVDDVPLDRIHNPAFWTMILAQWLREDGSEYHRVEMIYDVLLPWLVAPRALSAAAAAAAATDPAIVFRTPQRSGTDAWRAVVEAFRYCLRRFGGSVTAAVEARVAGTAAGAARARHRRSGGALCASRAADAGARDQCRRAAVNCNYRRAGGGRRRGAAAERHRRACAAVRVRAHGAPRHQGACDRADRAKRRCTRRVATSSRSTRSCTRCRATRRRRAVCRRRCRRRSPLCRSRIPAAICWR